jgi:hypothetical protein
MTFFPLETTHKSKFLAVEAAIILTVGSWPRETPQEAFNAGQAGDLVNQAGIPSKGRIRFPKFGSRDPRYSQRISGEIEIHHAGKENH